VLLARARRLHYTPALAEIDVDMLRGLDAAVLLPPRRWEWGAELEAFARACA
jgi:hypothetical protein